MRTQPNNAARAMRQVKPWIIVLMVFVALACGFAQSSPRAVRGIVVDREGAPLRGAIVQIEDLASLEIRSFVTQEHGVYYFMDLSPDRDYKLQARYRHVWGPVKTLSRFNSRKEATIDLKVDVRKEE
jgi:Carboxypeptidase regulatory-like domain